MKGVYVLRWHLTETLAIPPLDPKEPNPHIIVFPWWKKLVLWLLILLFLWSVWSRQWLFLVALLVLPVRLHRMASKYIIKNTKDDK